MECSSLQLLPNISIWKTYNCKDIHQMFDGCNSLSNLPNISQWNFEQILYGIDAYENCFSLLYKIDKFRTKTKKNIRYRRSNGQIQNVSGAENQLPSGINLFNLMLQIELIKMLNNK